MDPRTIAVQGLNTSPLLVAVQGLQPTGGTPPAPTDSVPRGGFIVNTGRLMGR